ncbi:hypothetical protein [Ascidiimonas sp. W6]|uniref:hypothetical protein n=1 Tax=Ascidiimonas meishanensis TaxID=3128903 RepID=UPI0030EF1F70
MEIPKFLLGDNTDFQDAIFVIHTDFPRFVIDLTTDEVEWLEDLDTAEAKELEEEMTSLIQAATDFYDREVKRYED